MTPPRMVSPDKRQDDLESSIRPLTLADFTGQEAARKNLKVFIEAAKARKDAWIMSCSLALRGLARRLWRRLWRANSA